MRALNIPGETWWNEQVDGLPIQLSESEAGFPSFPERGILELDYVVTRSKDQARRMRRDEMTLDLEERAVRGWLPRVLC